MKQIPEIFHFSLTKILSLIFFYDEVTTSVDQGRAVDACDLNFSKILSPLYLIVSQFRWVGYQIDDKWLDYQAERVAGNGSLYLKACYK